LIFNVEGPSQWTPTPLSEPKPEYLPSTESILQLRFFLLRHFPGGCRTRCADALAKIFCRLLENASWESLLRFLLFPKAVLRTPRHGAGKDNGEIPKGSVQSLIRDRILRAVHHSLPDLWDDLYSNLGQGPRRSERVVKGKKPPFPTTLIDTCEDDLTGMGDPKTLGKPEHLPRSGPTVRRSNTFVRRHA
jgi:hypothetical protein